MKINAIIQNDYLSRNPEKNISTRYYTAVFNDKNKKSWFLEQQMQDIMVSKGSRDNED